MTTFIFAKKYEYVYLHKCVNKERCMNVSKLRARVNNKSHVGSRYRYEKSFFPCS